MVVTTLDTFTSLMAGLTIFGILGNLAHELGTDDISNVVRGGTGLAFVSYPDAIAKFTVLPNVRKFYLMMSIRSIDYAFSFVTALSFFLFSLLKYCTSILQLFLIYKRRRIDV